MKAFAFDKNKLPFWIVFDIYALLKHPNYVRYLELLSDIIDEYLEKEKIFASYNLKEDKKNTLPTPL